MKKILLLVALVSIVLNVSAWTKAQDEGIVIFASQHLTPKAKDVVDKYLGDNYKDDVAYLLSQRKAKSSKYSMEVHRLHLDANLQPLEVEGDDALKCIEQNLAIVSAHESHSEADVTEALRIIIDLVCDMHYLSNVCIEGIPHSQKDFTVQRRATGSGARVNEISSIKWSALWGSYVKTHRGFFSELWAEDLAICHGKKYDEYTKGSLHDWATQNGQIVSEIYARVTPEYIMPRIEYLRYEDLNYEMMARAGLRLAKLLNEAIK